MTMPLAEARYLNLATFRKNGAEVHTPVWFARDGDLYYLFSAGDAGKVKRLRNSSRARVAPCNVHGKVLGPWLEAEAMLLADPDRERAHQALRRKYGWQMALLDFLAGLSGRRQRRAYIALRLKES